jgi:hypothetical protein
MVYGADIYQILNVTCQAADRLENDHVDLFPLGFFQDQLDRALEENTFCDLPTIPPFPSPQILPNNKNPATSL